MSTFEIRNPDYEAVVRQSFTQQGLLAHLSASLVKVSPGEVHIQMPYAKTITQQQGFVHAGALTSILDSACGYAALTLMPPESQVLSIEYKANFLSPAVGEKFLAIGRVIRAGRRITVCEGDVFALNASGDQKPLVTMLTSMIRQSSKPN
jgi:uncharacterized protein (TIGR00369 family)